MTFFLVHIILFTLLNATLTSISLSLCGHLPRHLILLALATITTRVHALSAHCCFYRLNSGIQEKVDALRHGLST